MRWQLLALWRVEVVRSPCWAMPHIKIDVWGTRFCGCSCSVGGRGWWLMRLSKLDFWGGGQIFW